MSTLTRRDWLKAAAGTLAAASLVPSRYLLGQEQGERPEQDPRVTVLNPRHRVPLSFIIDDSTCLVNMGHFCMPQFAEVWPDRAEYQKPWQKTPREIPDSFVRKFGEWCQDRGIKGKYSVVPYPACVGWLDRDLPGWPNHQLQESLELVRTLMLPNWDIHPEMVSHTWVINTKTGRPYEERTQYYMENWRWTDGKSVDELADYLSYALRILKNVGLPCEGVTTPGGFAGRVVPELAQATLQSVRDVFQAEIPHYFKHLYTGSESVAPKVQYAANLKGPDPQCVVSIIGCTGDWFGGWDGLTPGSVDLFITADLQQGRMVEVIERGEPAVMVCHWPGIYYNGEELGFDIFKEAVARVHARYDNLIWMKLSELARYWAAKELTSIQMHERRLELQAPFAAPDYTLRIPASNTPRPRLITGAMPKPLQQVERPLDLRSGTWCIDGDTSIACFDLPKGASTLDW